MTCQLGVTGVGKAAQTEFLYDMAIERAIWYRM